jgi:hypothetical protein
MSDARAACGRGRGAESGCPAGDGPRRDRNNRTSVEWYPFLPTRIIGMIFYENGSAVMILVTMPRVSGLRSSAPRRGRPPVAVPVPRSSHRLDISSLAHARRPRTSHSLLVAFSADAAAWAA